MACALVALCGCGAKDFDNENDRLRRLTLEQEGTIRALQAQRDELTAKLAESERSRNAAMSAEVLEAIPRCAGIGVGSLSGLQRPREGEEGDPKVVVYLDPFDGRQRFVQIVGTLTVDAIIAGPAGEAVATTTTAALGPTQVREAYRTSFTGPYYLVELLPDGRVPSEGTITLRARFVDALSGLTHEAEAVVRIRP